MSIEIIEDYNEDLCEVSFEEVAQRRKLHSSSKLQQKKIIGAWKCVLYLEKNKLSFGWIVG